MNLEARSQFQPWIRWLVRFILGGIFIYAAIIKIASPLDFADSIAAYRILPYSIINPFAWGLPFFELACGLLVLTGFLERLGLLGIIGVLVVFIVALGLALVRHLSIDCGCFGHHAWIDTNPWTALIRDVVLLGIASSAYLYSLRDLSDPV